MRHCLGGRKNKECCDMFKYRCWAQKALDTFLQILSWRPLSGSLRVLLVFFTHPLVNFSSSWRCVPRDLLLPGPSLLFLSVSLQLWLWSLTEKESPRAATVQHPGEQQVQIAGEWGRPRHGTLEGGMTLTTCCGFPAWLSALVGYSHSYSTGESIENEANFKV